MRKTIWISIIVTVVVFAGIGIYLLLYMKGMMERVTPEIRDVSLDWGSVTAKTTEITGTIVIYNPNSISVPIDKMSFDVRVDDIAFGHAETVDLHLEKASEVPVEIIAEIDNSEIPILMASHIRNGEKSTASIDIDITFDLGIGHITLPISMKQDVETDLLAYLPNIEPMTIEQTADIPLLGKKTFVFTLANHDGEWGRISDDSIHLDLNSALRNDNPFTLVSSTIKYSIESNGIVLAYGETGPFNIIGVNCTKRVDMDTTINTKCLGEWFARHIEQGERSTINVVIYMDLGIGETILQWFTDEEISMILWEETHVVQTDILDQISQEISSKTTTSHLP